MNTVKRNIVLSDSIDFTVTYGSGKQADVTITGLKVPDDAGIPWKVFYIERMEELLKVMKAGEQETHWTDRSSS